jgi:HK97 family phage major capsid protein
MTENRIESVPALSAVRAIPAALAPWRYKRLPEWQRDFRSADSDIRIQQFLRALARGERADLLQGDESDEGAPMDGTVGQLVPLELSSYVDAALYRFSKMHQMARIFTGTSTLRVPLQTSVSVSTWTAEGATIAADEPTLGKPTDFNLVLQKLTNLAVISNEALDDAFGLAEWLTLDVSQEMGQEEDLKFYSTGNGSTQPRGLELGMATTVDEPDQYYVPTGTQVQGNFQTPTFIDYKHIQNMFYSLPEQARSAAVWTGNDLIERALDDMLDGLDNLSGRPQFEMTEIPIGTISDGIANTPTRSVFGRPFVNMPGLLDESGTPGQDDNRIYFIDMRRSYAILRQDLRVDRSAMGAGFANDQTVFRFVHRVDGKPFERFASSPNFATGDFSQSAYVYTGAIKSIGNSDQAP